MQEFVLGFRVRMCTGSISLRGSCDCGNEPPDCTEGAEVLDQLCYCWPCKRGVDLYEVNSKVTEFYSVRRFDGGAVI
jgi:hypothetical protein